MHSRFLANTNCMIFVFLNILAICNFEIKEDENVKFLNIALTDTIEIDFYCQIIDFKGILIYYFDKIPRQIIIKLNPIDKSMTIILGCIEYQVNLNSTGNCEPGSAHEYSFIFKRKLITIRCNGQDVFEQPFKPSRKLCQDYPLPKLNNYSVFLSLPNYEEFIHYNTNKSPNSEHATLIVRGLKINNITIINSRKEFISSTNAKLTLTQSSYSTIENNSNSNRFDKKNETKKRETGPSENSGWIPYIVIAIVIVIAILIVIYKLRNCLIPCIQRLHGSVTIKFLNPIGNKPSELGNEMEHISPHTPETNSQIEKELIDTEQSETVLPGIITNRANDLLSCSSSEKDERESLIETGTSDVNDSSQVDISGNESEHISLNIPETMEVPLSETVLSGLFYHRHLSSGSRNVRDETQALIEKI